jgi:hypothetical protein
MINLPFGHEVQGTGIREQGSDIRRYRSSIRLCIAPFAALPLNLELHFRLSTNH